MAVNVLTERTGLLKYDAMCHAIAECVTNDRRNYDTKRTKPH